MSKISVKHYLNTAVKPTILRDREVYTVYCRMTMNRVNHIVQSREFENQTFTTSEFVNFEKTEAAELQFLREKNVIIRIIVAQLQLIPQAFDKKLFTGVYQLTHKNGMFYQVVQPKIIELFDIGYNGLRYTYNSTKIETPTNEEPKSYHKKAMQIRDIIYVDNTKQQNISITFYEFYTDEQQTRIKNALQSENLDINMEKLNAYMFSTLIWFICMFWNISNKNKMIADNYMEYAQTFEYLQNK